MLSRLSHILLKLYSYIERTDRKFGINELPYVKATGFYPQIPGCQPGYVLGGNSNRRNSICTLLYRFSTSMRPSTCESTSVSLPRCSINRS